MCKKIINNCIKPISNIKYGFSTRHSEMDQFHNIIGTYPIITCHQVHGDKIEYIENIDIKNPKPKADAMVTDKINVPIGIITADCGPVLFIDSKAKIIGAAHLGRKGTLLGLFNKVIDYMLDLGAKTENIITILGPMISKNNYEISKDIIDEIYNNYPEYISMLDMYDNGDKALLDIPLIIRKQAEKSSVMFYNVNMCTYDNEDLFYSYRRSYHNGENEKNRMISAVCLC